MFADMASRAPEEISALTRAADLADVGYTAVMDHLYPGMPVRGLTDNVARSIRRAGGAFGRHAVHGRLGVTRPGRESAGSDLATVHGHDASTGALTAEHPIRFVVHP